MLLRNQPMEEVLVQILRAAWLAATLPIVIASVPIPNLSFLRRTLIGFAGRGKIMQSSSQKFTIPQRLFLHFYAVAFLWTTLLLVATWAYAYSMVPLVAEPFSYSTITSFLTGGSTIRTDSYKLRQGYVAWEAVFLLLLMEFHVLRRLFETIHVFDYSPSARMHVIGYLTGLFFYIAAPLSLCGDCAVEVFNFVANLVTEFIVKGKNQMQVTELEIFQVLNPLFRIGWKHWIGAAVFLWGWIHQYHCHKILGSLRHSTRAEEYVIPQGDWFEIVSSPHYLSEIVIYASFVVATGGSNLTIWLLFAFVVANLSFAAVETHKWYRQKFEDYPRSRFAIIPFLLTKKETGSPASRMCWTGISNSITTLSSTFMELLAIRVPLDLGAYFLITWVIGFQVSLEVVVIQLTCNEGISDNTDKAM